MRMIAATLALLLAACGGDGETNGSDGGNAAGNGAAGGGGESGGTPTAGGSDVRMQAGEWETTVQILAADMPGMPAEAVRAAQQQPPTKVRTCLTEQQVAQPPADFITGSGQNGGCTTENMSMAGGRMQGTIQCSSEGTTMRTTIEGQFTATTYELTQNGEIRTGAGPAMTTRTRTSGRRIGDCPAGG